MKPGPKKKGKDMICKVCAKVFYLRKSMIKMGQSHCSTKCMGASRKGIQRSALTEFKKESLHPLWRGGQFLRGMYLLKREKGTNEYRPIHRIKMEKAMRRKLLKQEVVHHLDGDPANNDLSNLYLFPNNPEHVRYHELLKSIVKGYIKNNNGINKEVKK